MTEGQFDICSAVRAHAMRTPDKPFHIFLRNGEKSAFTYSDLWLRSENFAAHLAKRGVCEGSVVVISMPMGPDLLAGFLGAMRIGTIPTIMPYPNVKQKEDLFWSTHDQLFARIDPACFILSSAIADLYDKYLSRYSDRILRPEEVSGELDTEPSIDPDSVAFLQHSSGTTALKKGVRLTHRAVVDHVAGYARVCRIDSDSRIFSWLPLYHDMGLISCFIMPMVVGCTVTAMDNFEWTARPMSMLRAIAEDRLEYAWMPNFGFAHLARTCADPGQFDLSSVKALINCSEPCRPDTHTRFLDHFARSGIGRNALQVCYAMAENVFAVTQTEFDRPVGTLDVSVASFEKGQVAPAQPGEASLAFASCGRALPETEVFIVDDQRFRRPEGWVGEVAIRSPSLFAGYNGRDDLTAKVLDGGTYYTGDLGLIYQGELYLAGRKDDLIIAYGRNLLPHELEAIVNTVPGIKAGRSVVFDIYSDQIGSNVIVVMAEIIAGADDQLVTRAIRQALGAGAGITPYQVMLLPEGELIKTTSGKISRSGNRAAFLSSDFKRELQ